MDVQFTDLQVRALLKVPSIDCLIARLRLAYLARISRSRPRALLGLLHLRVGAKRLPWVIEAAKDCHRLRDHGVLPATYPDFFEEPEAWQSLLEDPVRWKHLVDGLYFVESVTDRCAPDTADAVNGRLLAFACDRCDSCFASQTALESHCRAKHGDRLQIRKYFRESVCPCCGTDFRERIRCVGHLSNRRRSACSDWVRLHVQPMLEAEVSRLDQIDRELRREAWRSGHSTHLAKLPAKRCNTHSPTEIR